MKKERVMFTDVKDYGVRFNLKRETELPMGSADVQNLLRNMKTWKNTFVIKSDIHLPLWMGYSVLI